VSWIAAIVGEADRNELFKRLYDMADNTPQRVPLTDWYDTVKGTQNGF